jgi:hypothetical protein
VKRSGEISLRLNTVTMITYLRLELRIFLSCNARIAESRLMNQSIHSGWRTVVISEGRRRYGEDSECQITMAPCTGCRGYHLRSVVVCGMKFHVTDFNIPFIRTWSMKVWNGGGAYHSAVWISNRYFFRSSPGENEISWALWPKVTLDAHLVLLDHIGGI